MIALMFALQLQSGIEVTEAEMDVTIAGDVAIARVTAKFFNRDTEARTADLTFLLPKDAVVVELDGEGPFEIDSETVRPAVAARSEVLRLTSEARRRIGEEGRSDVERRRDRPPCEPQLLEKVGPRSYRLRVYPMLPRDVVVFERADGAVRDVRFEEPAMQRSDIYFIQRIEGASLDLSVGYQGTRQRLTDAPEMRVTIRGISNADARARRLEKAGDGTLTTQLEAGGSLKLTWREATTAHVGAVADPETPYDLDWARACLTAAAADDEALALEHKLVTKRTSILRAESALYRALGWEVPAQAEERLVR